MKSTDEDRTTVSTRKKQRRTNNVFIKPIEDSIDINKKIIKKHVVLYQCKYI